MCFMERAISTTAAVEEWRPIAGFEGLYEVSNLGRIRSLDRYVATLTFLGEPSQRFSKGRVLKMNKTPNGYLMAQLCKDGKRVNSMVHRLVAQAFIPNPDNLSEINHKDQDKHNNQTDNLEWCNHKYNINYGDARERQRDAISRPIEQLTMDGQHVAYFRSAKELERLSGGRYYERCIGRVAKCKTTRNSSVYGFRWRYVEKTDNLTYFTEPFEPKNLKKDRMLEQLTIDGQHVAYYRTLTEACKAIGAKKSSICNSCRGLNKTAYGYRWRYVK